MSHRYLLVMLLFLMPAGAVALEDVPRTTRSFSIGAGPSLLKFDSNFKITNTRNGDRVFVDTEGTLGLPEKDTSPLIFMSYRFSGKHSLAASYVGIRRENELLNVNLDLGDYTAFGNVTIRDKTKYYSFNYDYTLFRDERSFVLASFGIFGLDLGLSLDASGGIRNGSEVIDDDEVAREMGIFVPLPLLGLDFWWAYTSRWGLGTKVAIIGGSYADIDAAVLDTSIRGVYRIAKHFEAFVGIKYFSADVNINDNPYRYEIDYGLNGLIGGMSYKF